MTRAHVLAQLHLDSAYHRSLTELPHAGVVEAFLQAA